MCLKRTKKDVLEAYKVYKCADAYTSKLPADDKDEYIILSTLMVLYGGLTYPELHAILPISKATLKKVLNNGLYKYRIFECDEGLVLGRDVLGTTLCKGVWNLKKGFRVSIQKNEMELPTLEELKTFTTMLSNTSAHVNIIKDNIQNISGKFVLSHINTLFNTVVNKQIHADNSCLNNLTTLGYMRVREQNIELNRTALMYNKEPRFEIHKVQRDNITA